MEKSTLTDYEYKCIQEEPPYCQAVCPFSVDVKSFMVFIEKKEYGKAFSVLEKTLPLTEIISRVCDHPCESECIRNKIDSSLSIGDLEKFCAQKRDKRKKKFLPPKNGKKVGMWGSGLSSLVAAWDLVLKGYSVEIHDAGEKAGGHLLKLDEDVLKPEIINNQIGELEKSGVIFKQGSEFSELVRDDGSTDFDAVYIGFDSKEDTFRNIKKENGIPVVDSFLKAGDPEIFAGGFHEIDMKNNYSYSVMNAFQGRKAATSIDRVINNVSISAGREKEGIYKTRLTTEISDIEKTERIDFKEKKDSLTEFNEDKAVKEASRCIKCDCSRCLKVCEYLRSFKAYPRKYAREIYNNISIVMGDRKGNLLINSCSLCGLCEEVCPNDFSMADLCISARQEMNETGKMPESAHEFAVQEMEWALGDNCFFASHSPGKNRSEVIFFPGCQLTGSSPQQVEEVYRFLNENGEKGVGFVSGCCGAPAKWAGREELFHNSIKRFKSFWEESGKPEVITACTSCTAMLKEQIADIRIKSLISVLLNKIDKLPFSLNKTLTEKIGIIDPCTARDDKDIQKRVRSLTEKIGLETEELSASGSLTECCGFGGLVFNANKKLSKDILEKRSIQSDNDYLAYCSMCRDRIASAGKRVIHILDLFWPETEEPQLRGDPGFSNRHNNLALFKRKMLSDLWKEEVKEKGEESKIKISIASEVRKVMEEDFILESDIRKVLENYLNEGKYFKNNGNDSLITSYRPSNVCFWVEFRKEKESFIILDTWCHRMGVAKSDKFEPDKITPESDVDIKCGKCSIDLKPYKNHVEYLKSRFDVTLPQCDKCGEIFISSSTARGKMAEVEKILEDK